MIIVKHCHVALPAVNSARGIYKNAFCSPDLDQRFPQCLWFDCLENCVFLNFGISRDCVNDLFRNLIVILIADKYFSYIFDWFSLNSVPLYTSFLLILKTDILGMVFHFFILSSNGLFFYLVEFWCIFSDFEVHVSLFGIQQRILFM